MSIGDMAGNGITIKAFNYDNNNRDPGDPGSSVLSDRISN